MLSIRNPEIYRLMQYVPGGLVPFKSDDKKMGLVVKGHKEMLLTAKLRQQINIYVVPIHHKNCDTICLVTAFFDDEDQPLTITTPLVKDRVSQDFFYLFSSKSCECFLLDEHSREYLSYSCSVSVPQKTKRRLETARFLDPATPIDDLINVQNKAYTWFSTRVPEDDSGAISIEFSESLHPTDIAVVDLRSDELNYGGSSGYELSILEREQPGDFQEEDILRCLKNIFNDSQIYKGPLRTYDNEEVCDILVIDDNRFLFIQAKDNPNTESIVFATMKRKRSKAHQAGQDRERFLTTWANK